MTGHEPFVDGQEPILSLENVTLWLSGREILHEVSFNLRTRASSRA